MEMEKKTLKIMLFRSAAPLYETLSVCQSFYPHLFLRFYCAVTSNIVTWGMFGLEGGGLTGVTPAGDRNFTALSQGCQLKYIFGK